ncbi:uncharacterized protein LOC124808049 [Hydra vulgaris]|uniref:uncharacterized protein LOC124808049 n=1 Tax=Hydra vulgaris TaxID=6087 RepID=UPI0032EA591B
MAKNKSFKNRKVKRVFQGNRYTKKTVEVFLQQPDKDTNNDGINILPCASSTKLNISIDKADQPLTKHDDFFFFFHFPMFKDLICSIGSCGECNSKDIALEYLDEKAKGFSIQFCIKCATCEWTYFFNSSRAFSIPDRDTRGVKSQEINVRTVMAFREIGQGHEAMKIFASILNMPPPMSLFSYNEINSDLLKFYEAASCDSMKDAVTEIRKRDFPNAAENDIVDIQIGIDGSWQKRGHSSLNGVCTAVAKANRKVVDYQVFSKFCRGCALWQSKRNKSGYGKFLKTHVCDLNHFKSSGAMESAGALSFFTESLAKYNVRYSHYIGDGDTESYTNVVKAKPYGEDLVPVKIECVGHVQKRLGTRLRQMQCDLKGKKLEDGKIISGKGRLTDKIINKMQNFYGMSIRQNTLEAWSGDRTIALYNMKKSVLAVLCHCSNISNSEERHQFCPRTKESWCKYWQNDKNYKPSINLPLAIKSILKDTFLALRSDDLLSRCLDGATQNPNEAFNQIIWKKCPKNIFVTKKLLPGSFMIQGSWKKDVSRVKNTIKNSTPKQKRARRKRRCIRKGYIDKEKEKEGVDSYITGNF